MIWKDLESNDEIYYQTLNRDVELTMKPNGKWDLTFENGDYKIVEGLESLYNACIIALLTGYNEIGRNDIPLYEDFGNRSYELLKENKGNMVKYKLKSYFTNCLNNMRRVGTVLNVEVSERKDSPYSYHVFFNIKAVTGEILKEEVLISEFQTPTRLEMNNHEVVRSKTDNKVRFTLFDNHGLPLSYQMINLYVDGTLIGRKLTNEKGECELTYTIPKEFITKIYGEMDDSVLYESTISDEKSIVNALFDLSIDENLNIEYKYEDEYPHPDFTLGKDGHLIMTYNNEIINCKKVEFDQYGHVIIEV